MDMREIEKELRKLMAVKTNVRSIQKRMPDVQRAAKRAGSVHLFRANELQWLVDRFFNAVNEQIINLEQKRKGMSREA